MTNEPSPTTDPRWRALQPSLVDHVTAEVAAAFRLEGIRSILLRGRATAAALYDDPADRFYGDVDLLVDPTQFDGARTTLRQLGFAGLSIEVSRHEPRPYSEVWSRDEPPVIVDLHNTLSGVGAPSEAVWQALAEKTERLELRGSEIETLSPGGTAFVLALHAGKHGKYEATSRDLGRALERLPFDAWREAAALAERLDATAAFAAGLRLVAGGPERLERLEVARKRSLEAELRAASAPHMALALTWLARGAATPRQKLAIVARRLFPPAEFMRAVYPNRGRLGLAAAYVERPITLLTRLPRALRALWQARRAVSRGD